MTVREKQIEAIRTIPKALRRKVINAMEKLLKHYSKAPPAKKLKICPICDVLCYYCRQCPWVIMTGKNCIQYRAKSKRFWFDYVRELRNGGNSSWNKMRIRQLKKWIEVWESVGY